MSQAAPPPERHIAMWRRVLAAILDFFTVFFVGGYIIGALTGNLNSNGFTLQGTPAIILFVLIFAYFIAFHRYLGGTLWQRILRAR